MAKCERCGKKLFLDAVRLKDLYICRKCTAELGWEPVNIYLASLRNYTWEDVKDGMSAMHERNKRINEEFKKNNPGLVEAINSLEDDDYLFTDDEKVEQTHSVDLNVNISVKGSWHKELNETEGEAEIFDIITKMFPNEHLKLKRKSNDYVTVMYGEWDIVRIKFNDRAQWVMFPIIEAKQQRHHIDAPKHIEDYKAVILDSLNHAKKYEN